MNTPHRHLVGVWNPSYEADAMDAHVRILLNAARERREGKRDDDDVYVWWGKVRSRRPANRLPEWRAGFFLVASWLSNQLSAPVNAASAKVYESGAWPRGAGASRQGRDVPERPHGYRWMTCRGMLKSVAAC